MSRIYLVRHGENRANLTKEFSHRRVDYPLTEKGRLQASQTADFFCTQKIDAIYSSPLRRALETAEFISERLDLPITVMEEFREVNVGRLEDEPPSAATWKLHDEIMAAWDQGQHEACFPGGEDYHTLRNRLADALKTVIAQHAQETLILVAHGGVINTIVRNFCGDVDWEQLRHTENHNCSITEVEFQLVNEQMQGQLIHWALCEHLSGQAAQLEPGSPHATFFEEKGG